MWNNLRMARLSVLFAAICFGTALFALDRGRISETQVRGIEVSDAVIDGDVESGSVMAGQSVGMVKREEPIADIIAELVDEAVAALGSRG